MRAVISPNEARSWLDHLVRQGEALPEWAYHWDGESSVWLDDWATK